MYIPKTVSSSVKSSLVDFGKGEDLQTDEEGKDVDQDLLAMTNHRKTNRCSEGNSFEVNHRGKEGKWIDSKKMAAI